MRRSTWFSATAVVSALAMLLVFFGMLPASSAYAGEATPTQGYKVLSPITHANLTIFPVVASSARDTSGFLTLDEGLRSGEVVVTEAGRIAMVRRPGQRDWLPNGGAQVNNLVLVNNSKRPLLLLAGEIVTGGKQDRVIATDRIVPAGSDPMDLGVFCVEPGRWTATSDKFGGFSQMAQPSVRHKAMGAKSQQEVWAEVNSSKDSATRNVAAASPAAAASLGGTSSYARVMGNDEVKRQVDAIAAPVQASFTGVLNELRDRNAVGVVVAVNGRIIWADIFASTSLLEKYWPKLSRSYAAEAYVRGGNASSVDLAAAQRFLNEASGTREVSEVEPGVYRHTEVSGNGYRVFELTSLLPKTGFDLHIAKMAE
ncbi:MAG TPA: DUF6569 family protein [Terriglobales bacterium]|nr:DUF6569 family protein [Terriglobales bacterium]